MNYDEFDPSVLRDPDCTYSYKCGCCACRADFGSLAAAKDYQDRHENMHARHDHRVSGQHDHHIGAVYDRTGTRNPEPEPVDVEAEVAGLLELADDLSNGR